MSKVWASKSAILNQIKQVMTLQPHKHKLIQFLLAPGLQDCGLSKLQLKTDCGSFCNFKHLGCNLTKWPHEAREVQRKVTTGSFWEHLTQLNIEHHLPYWKRGPGACIPVLLNHQQESQLPANLSTPVGLTSRPRPLHWTVWLSTHQPPFQSWRCSTQQVTVQGFSQ